MLFLTGYFSQAQIKAVTETGDAVVLYDNGTWKYVNETASTNAEIPLNPAVFTKSDGATFLLKSDVIPAGFWLDPKKWSFKKNTGDSDEEYDLEMKNGNVYCIILTEEAELAPDVLRKVVLDNAREAAPDLHVLREEYRIVNGHKVLMIKMAGTVDGIRIAYIGYYFSDADGTVQYLSYTTQNLLDKYQDAMEELLNGLVKL